MQEDPYTNVLQRLAAVSSAENRKRMRVMDSPLVKQHDPDTIGEKPAYNRDLDGI